VNNTEKIIRAYIYWMDNLNETQLVCMTCDTQRGTTRPQLISAVCHLTNKIDCLAYPKFNGKQHRRLQKFVVIEDASTQTPSVVRGKRKIAYERVSGSTPVPITQLPPGYVRFNSPNAHAHLLIEASGNLSNREDLVTGLRTHWGNIREAGRYSLVELYTPGWQPGKWRAIGDWKNYLAGKGCDAFDLRLCHLNLPETF
jgi:hypothetical protein